MVTCQNLSYLLSPIIYFALSEADSQIVRKLFQAVGTAKIFELVSLHWIGSNKTRMSLIEWNGVLDMFELT